MRAVLDFIHGMADFHHIPSGRLAAGLFCEDYFDW
jgi:hypothetical protein